MHNIFRKQPVKVKITGFSGEVLDEILFVSAKKGSSGKFARTGGVDFFSDIKTSYAILDLFPEDTIKSLKEKIYIATGLFPCEQCLKYKGNVIGLDISIKGEDSKTENINGIPLNKILYNNRENIKIVDLESENLIDLFTGPFELECLSLKSASGFPQDSADIELVYWSILPKFPYFSLESFKAYVSGGLSNFPNLFPEKSILEKKLKQQDKILNEIYDMLGEDLKKYNVSLINGINDQKAELKFIINELVVFIQQRGEVNLSKLFTILNSSEHLPVIIYNTRTTSFTKVHYMMENAIPLHLYKSKVHHALYVLCHDVIFEIRANGFVNAIISDSYGQSIDFKMAEKMIDTASEFLFEALDSLKLAVFKNTPVYDYYEILKISTTLIWFQSIEDFNGLMNAIIETRLASKKKDKTFNRFIWEKGAHIDSINYWNEFGYLTNNDLEYMPNNHFDLENKYSELVVKTRNMTFEDFKNFMKMIIFIIKNAKIESSSELKKNNLKMLRLLDPESYDAGKLNNDVLYVRFCQKQRQPVPVLPSDIGDYPKDDRLLKFFNYTKKQDLYFYCPNKNYPVAGFITGHHPNGNCLVCCKKKKTKDSKYDAIHNACLEDKIFINQKDLSRARYVINFGKIADPGRLSTIPSLIVKFLLYNENDYNIISEAVTLNIFKYAGKIYSIDRLRNLTKTTKVQEIPLVLLENFLNKPVWKRKRKGEELIKPIEVLENAGEDRKLKKHYSRIQKADLNDPIFVHYDEAGKKYVVVDGFHRLAAAFMKNQSFVKAKLITAKQLERCLLGKYDIKDNSFLPTAIEVAKKGADDKEPFYYIYGVSYVHENVQCSYLTSLAAVFEMKIECFIDDVINRLGKIEYVGKFNASDIKEQIIGTFKQSKFVSKVNWNEIFENILPILYNFVPLVLQYKSANDVRVVLNQQANDWAETNYVIIIKNEEFYNPIFLAVPYAFAKFRRVEKRFFTEEDYIITLFQTLCEKQTQDFDFTINKVSQLKKKITNIFSFGGMIYAVEVEDKVYISVEQVKTNELKYDTLKLKTYNLKDAVAFLALYSLEHGDVINVHTIYILNKKVCAYGIADMVNFASGTLEEARKYWPDAKIESWNYSPETIINGKNNKEDKLYSAYMELNKKRDDYEEFKKKFFEKGIAIAEFMKKKPTTLFEQSLWEEMHNPIKKKLMEEGIYSFKKLHLHKQKNENIYIRIK